MRFLLLILVSLSLFAFAKSQETGACCRYDGGTGELLSCDGEVEQQNCFPIFDVGAAWFLEQECSSCPEVPHETAFCRCGETCCPFVDQTAGIGILVGAGWAAFAFGGGIAGVCCLLTGGLIRQTRKRKSN